MVPVVAGVDPVLSWPDEGDLGSSAESLLLQEMAGEGVLGGLGGDLGDVSPLDAGALVGDAAGVACLGCTCKGDWKVCKSLGNFGLTVCFSTPGGELVVTSGALGSCGGAGGCLAEQVVPMV